MSDVFTRRRLPHWDKSGAAYFVTTCLEGSIPAQGLLDIERHRGRLKLEGRPAAVTEADWRVDRWKRVFACRERWLDSHPAVRHLSQPELAAEVELSLKFFHGSRYVLLAWVIMPSHYHWVFQPLASWVESLGDAVDRTPRERIVHSVNRHSARQCNKILGREGTFWQHESYDHWIRDEEELERIVDYIHTNPVVAGLVDSAEKYQFSSAYREASF